MNIAQQQFAAKIHEGLFDTQGFQCTVQSFYHVKSLLHPFNARIILSTEFVFGIWFVRDEMKTEILRQNSFRVEFSGLIDERSKLVFTDYT